MKGFASAGCRARKQEARDKRRPTTTGLIRHLQSKNEASRIGPSSHPTSGNARYSLWNPCFQAMDSAYDSGSGVVSWTALVHPTPRVMFSRTSYKCVGGVHEERTHRGGLPVWAVRASRLSGGFRIS